MKNKNIAVLGSQFGDEAKARMVHWLAKDYDYIVRFSGSSNAGHTIYDKDKKIVRHLIPSANFNYNNKAFLGSDMVINLEELLLEVLETKKIFPHLNNQIIVDPDAFVVLPEHIIEDKTNNTHIGSTGKGVTPSYKSKIGRNGVRISSFIKDNAEIIKALHESGVVFKNSIELYNEFINSRIIFEGSQSILLDIQYGMYPYVTSGNCGLNGIINSGFAKFLPSKIYGIAKCYSTRVGSGPFPTEISGTEAEDLRERGYEYGATTGRPRRVGYLDLPALDYACKKGGITHLIITKFDILNGMEKVKVCDAYQKVPVCPDDFSNAIPQYTEVPGWNDASDTKQLAEFISKIEKFTGCTVEYISCGTSENDVIRL